MVPPCRPYAQTLHHSLIYYWMKYFQRVLFYFQEEVKLKQSSLSLSKRFFSYSRCVCRIPLMSPKPNFSVSNYTRKSMNPNNYNEF